MYMYMYVLICSGLALMELNAEGAINRRFTRFIPTLRVVGKIRAN